MKRSRRRSPGHRPIPAELKSGRWFDEVAIAERLGVIRLTEPTCKKCGYLLVGLTEHRCPECGAAFHPDMNRSFACLECSGALLAVYSLGGLVMVLLALLYLHYANSPSDLLRGGMYTLLLTVAVFYLTFIQFLTFDLFSNPRIWIHNRLIAQLGQWMPPLTYFGMAFLSWL